MLCIRIDYLTGRVYSAQFEDGDRKLNAEWPPHPSRLFSALVAAWGEAGQDPGERRVLEWLEQQPPPEIVYSEATFRDPAVSFVPINPETESVPTVRERKERRFPSATPVEPTVYMVWPESTAPAELEPVLDGLTGRVHYLGHSAGLVEVWRADAPPEGWKRLRPVPDGERRMRVPSPGRLEELIDLYRRFEQNPVKLFRPTRGATWMYAETRPLRAATPRSCFDLVVLRQTGGESLSLRGTLLLTSALRKAVLRLGPHPPPECLSGHAPESTPWAPARSERDHLGWVPLAHVGSRHAIGKLLGAAALVPTSLTPEERAACMRVIPRVRTVRLAELGEWRLEPAAAEVPQLNLRPWVWMGPARHWATVTPFVFDRYPEDPYGEEARQVVRAACRRIGLPEPEAVSLTPVSPHIGVPPSFLFQPAPPRSGKPQRFHLHVVLSFAEAVQGPVVIGAGRYYGYGLARPLGRWPCD